MTTSIPNTEYWKKFTHSSEPVLRENFYGFNTVTHGSWYAYSTWCNRTFGPGEWEFLDHRFMFKNGRDLLLFTLKWA